MPATKGDSQSSWPTPAVLLLDIKKKIHCMVNIKIRSMERTKRTQDRNLLEVTTLITPGGIPASSAREAKARADKGGYDDVQDVTTTNVIKGKTSNLTTGCPLQASRHKCSRLQALLQPRDQPDEFFVASRSGD